MTFEDNGSLYVSKSLNPKVLAQWKIVDIRDVGPFRDEQLFFKIPS